MIKMEDWVTIKQLKKHGIGTRTIADQLGISRNTVKRALAMDQPPQYKRKTSPNPDVEPFKDYIIEKVINKNFIGSRILNEIISKGYKGSKSAFYRFLHSLNLKDSKSYCPYETSPGEQAQFDWSQYTVIIEGKLTLVYIFNYILGYSRYRIYEASLSDTASSVYEALENSMNQTFGVAGRVQTDNAKCFVINASKDNFQWNPRYLAFCGHFGFKPTRSLPRHPWSKGKVENPFRYLEEHFIKGNEFSDFEDFLNKLKQFQDEVNSRVHITTKQRPISLFEQEKQFLYELPESRFVGIKEQVRKVTTDCLISFDGNRYSVPHHFVSKEVWIKVSKGYLIEIYSSGNVLIAQHKLSISKGKIIMDKSHYQNHWVERGNWQRLSQMFCEIFSSESWFLDKLKTQKRINYHYHLTQIVNMMAYYPKELFLKAIYASREYNMYTYNFIKGYLDTLHKESFGQLLKTESGEQILKKTLLPVQTGLNIKRSLHDYRLELFTENQINEKNT